MLWERFGTENIDYFLDAAIRESLYDSNVPWNELQNRTVLITGVTGLVGGALAHALLNANAKYKLRMRLIGSGRNKSKGEELQTRGLQFVPGDIREPFMFMSGDGRIDYIFHCAAITKSAEMAQKPIDVITTSVYGTRNALELARDTQCRSFVYLSSMEIYGQTDRFLVRESDLGALDLSSPRSSYPESKRMCENLCAAYAKQYGVPVRIARLAQTFGSGTPEDDTRVFAQFAKSAIQGRDIELHTQGESRGNYCHTADAVRALITILLCGKDGEAYNIANHTASMTIREMAELVADEVCEGNIRVAVKIPEDIKQRGYAPDSGFILSTSKLEALGWAPKYGLEEMYRHMLASWKG